MPMRDIIRTDKLNSRTAKAPARDQARALRASRMRNRAACPRRRLSSLPPPAVDQPGSGYQHYSGDQGYLLLQINVICVLLFLIGTTAIVKHPDWFGGTPITMQSLVER
jgi:hypothetical protein